MTKVSHEQLKKNLFYDPVVGVFLWRKKLGRKFATFCDFAGRIDYAGYVKIKLNGREYSAHRLAWFYVHGDWPSEEIDHRNGKRSDNRIDNLREATKTQNAGNTACKSNNKLGVKGVRQRQNGLYEVRFHQKTIGLFVSLEDAALAYLEKSKSHYGDFSLAIRSERRDELMAFVQDQADKAVRSGARSIQGFDVIEEKVL